MSMVMFATICDHCGVRGPEYNAFPGCIECGDDICPSCMVPGSYEPEYGEALCVNCCEEDA
jgi:hypothetical protein